MPETTLRHGWMTCYEDGRPHGHIHDTEDAAKAALGPYGHVRPVDVEITVRGFPPAPWYGASRGSRC